MTKPLRVGFCVSGGGRLFRAAAIQAPRLNIVPALVIGEAGCAGDLSKFCADRGIPFRLLDPRNRARFDRDLTRLCREARLDLLCLTFDRIIPPALVRFYRGRIINVHMGLLPAFKGARGLQQAVTAGVRFAGATIHEVDEQVDHGAVIAQCVLGIRRGETAGQLGRRLFGVLRLMFLQVLHWYATRRVMRDRQGRVWIRDGAYGELPVAPALEDAFPD